MRIPFPGNLDSLSNFNKRVDEIRIQELTFFHFRYLWYGPILWTMSSIHHTWRKSVKHMSHVHIYIYVYISNIIHFASTTWMNVTYSLPLGIINMEGGASSSCQLDSCYLCSFDEISANEEKARCEANKRSQLSSAWPLGYLRRKWNGAHEGILIDMHNRTPSLLVGLKEP